MKNNYKQLTSGEPTALKRSASHALRSSFRLPKKRTANSQFHALNIEQLPSYIPPKAAALLEINLPPPCANKFDNSMTNVETQQKHIKIAAIRKPSVWANGSSKISLPSNYNHERGILTTNKQVTMHIGGFNFLQQNNKSTEASTTSTTASDGILKEFNKNTSSDNFKVNKKYKFGHVNKSFEPSSAYALFECVEENQYDQLKSLLEQKQLNINSLNDDGFSILDLAVLINNRTITKLLLQHGAQTGNFPVENIENHLNTLLTDTEKKLAQFVTNAGTSSSQSCIGLETERQKLAIEKRIKLIRKMINGWQRLKVPDAPFSFTIDVIGTNSVLIKILEPIEETICTTFRVQYSPREDFSIIIAERTITEWNIFQGTMGVNFHLDNLVQKRRYFFRACSGNLKGYGTYKNANPASVIPSSWKDVEDNPRDAKFYTQKETFESISKTIQQSKIEEPADEQRRKDQKKKTTIKHLFTGVSKFHKSLRRGIYLACIIFSNEKVLVTNEDFIPVIEIDESYPTNLNNDFYWLMKISTSWDDVKNLRIEMEKNSSTNKTQFRFKILNAIHQMQMALGITDLGQFFYKPLKDSNGTIVLSCSLYVKDPKLAATTLHTRWISMSKLQKKVTVLLEDSPINEILLNSIQSQINYWQASKVKLSRGLYLGYLKMFSSMDTIQIICQAKTPNVLPNCKIRDNPHISAEEWTVLKSNLERDKEGKLSQAQENFIESLKLSLNRLFKFMNVDNKEAHLHRIFDIEVIELNEDVSFLIVCPPLSDTIVSKDSPNLSVDLSLKRSDLISLPLIVHEMIQFNTYQPNLLQKYARLSFLTEFDMIAANLKQREAFSTNELQIAKDKLKASEDTMNELNSAWKSIRWMMDVITFYRSKDITNNKLDILRILQFVSSYNIFFKMPDPQMRGFHVKSPIRGSWAGPQTFKGSEAFMYGDHSKSEQLLTSMESQNTTTTTTSTAPSSIESKDRKASVDSNYYSAGEQNDFLIPRLPTSKSEDTLVVTRKKGPTNLHQRKRPTTVNPLSFGTDSQSSGSKTNGLVVHRINTHVLNDVQESPSKSSQTQSDLSPSKSKLRVSHHPKSSVNHQHHKKDFKKYHAEEESTLVTFLKPTLAAIQNESHNRSFKDPLIIVEDEAIEMISSPFSKTPVERSKASGKQQQLFGKNQSSQFFRSNLHSKNVHAICQDADIESSDWRAIDALKQIEDASETSTHNDEESFKSDIQSQIEEMLMERDYVNQPSIENSSSLLQIYAAYDTGLASGTSLKLKCTQKTTAKEVVDLVIKQLNMAVVLRGKDGPVYGANQLDDFCLVAVIGARERCLRDDFRPLDLQNPWKKGKLFVRFKHDLLAAIEINASNREAFSL